jgi:hypothetical protein
VENTKGNKNIIDKIHVSRMKPRYSRNELFKILELRDSNEIEINRKSEIQINKETPINKKNQSQESDQETETNYSLIGNKSSEETEIYSWSDPDVADSEKNKIIPTPPLIPNEGVRRSSRTRKPTKFFRSMTLSFLFSIILQVSLCYLQKSNPILWYKSDKPVITGVNRVVINVKFNSPCLVFKEPPLNVWRAEELYEWCDQQFKDDFLNPLMNFCETPKKVVHPN